MRCFDESLSKTRSLPLWGSEEPWFLVLRMVWRKESEMQGQHPCDCLVSKESRQGHLLPDDPRSQLAFSNH